MWYKVKDATSAVANVDDYSESAKLLAATTLRNVLGTRNLGDILSERESIAQEMEVSKTQMQEFLFKTGLIFTPTHLYIMCEYFILLGICMLKIS